MMLALMALLVLQTPQPAYRKQIPPPINADSAWAAVKRCAARVGAHEYGGGGLQDVKWFETTEWEAMENIGDTPWQDLVMLGQWLPPDTILIARRMRLPSGQYRGWGVAHELLHHLLRGPPFFQHQETHPYVPFGAPCEVMAWQHVGDWGREFPKPALNNINRTPAPYEY